MEEKTYWSLNYQCVLYWVPLDLPCESWLLERHYGKFMHELNLTASSYRHATR